MVVEDFSRSQDDAYLNEVERRLRSVDLTWTRQVCDLLENRVPLGRDSNSLTSLNDYGCCAFQFYKEVKTRDWGLDYLGYDNAVSYINIGLSMYPELAKSYAVKSLNSTFKPRESDVGVMSATLEHLSEWRFVLRSILRATRSALVLRTFLGEQNLTHWLRKSENIEPYRVQQFAYEELCGILAQENFFAEILKDNDTLSLPKFVPAGKGFAGCVRTCYVVVCRPI